MNKRAEKVKRWRRNTKRRLVEAFGGKCGICGYDKCDDGLDFHHLIPEEKDFSFAKIRKNIVGWDRIVVEIRKCVMICSNCHREVHAGYTVMPENMPRFNENYSDYRNMDG